MALANVILALPAISLGSVITDMGYPCDGPAKRNRSVDSAYQPSRVLAKPSEQGRD